MIKIVENYQRTGNPKYSYTTLHTRKIYFLGILVKTLIKNYPEWVEPVKIENVLEELDCTSSDCIEEEN